MFGSKMDSVEKAIRKNNLATLISLSDNKDKEVSLAAIAGIASVGGQEASNYLISRLGSQDPEVRIAVARSLGTLGDKHTKAYVSAQLSKETDPEVREAMGQAMTHIKSY